jgi:hypothetical protein
MDPQVDRVLGEARARGIDIREKLGGGSFCEAWAVGDALVMRIPRALAIVRDVEFERGYGPLVGEHVSPTGPFHYLPVASTDLARELFERSIDRQRDVQTGPLARFVDRLELADTPVALHERAPGRALAAMPFDDIRAALPRIARALVELHDTLGFHGDLKPAHVFVDGERVTFIDPLPKYTGAIGSAGYTLPTLVVDPDADRDEGRLAGDLASLAAIAAEASGVDLGWGDLLYMIANLFNGRFGRGFSPQEVLADRLARVRTIDDPALRGWVERACTLVLAPYTRSIKPYEAGITRTALLDLASWVDADPAKFAAFRAALAPLAARVHARPTLMDFLLEGERLPPGAWDYAATYNCHAESFATMRDAAHELRALFATFGVPAAAAPPPIAQPRNPHDVLLPLRALLVDLSVLLDAASYTPARLAELGARIARVFESIADLERDNRYQHAARRYVNYVCGPITDRVG